VQSDKIILTLCNLYINDNKCKFVTLLSYHIKPNDTIPIFLTPFAKDDPKRSQVFENLSLKVDDIICCPMDGNSDEFWNELERRLKASKTTAIEATCSNDKNAIDQNSIVEPT